MTDGDVIILVNNIFGKIHDARTISELESIHREHPSKFKYDENKYPPLKFEFSEEEIKSIKNIFEDGNINLQQFLKYPIAKLLYALIWKQGDLAKLKPIVEGMIEEQEMQNKEAAIFRQFGKHLVNRAEPIVDQHVLRAYAIFKNQGDILKVSSFRKQEKFDLDMIDSYKTWFEKNKLLEEGSGTYLDHVLFGLGKTIKTSKVKAGVDV